MVFVDTGPFVARYLPNDPFRERALRVWKRLENSELYTSNHILDETFTLMARRAGYPFAAERAQRFYSSDAFEIISSTREDEVEAVRFFQKFGDQAISFTDSVSFAIMRRYGISTAFTFDRHFVQAGFDVIGFQ
ncbi:MAG TPA: PIN domain-containing protein [Bryobacteraceae bacterium]|jgi:predicted nucleic acid-binding protein|nr:PIN domain-containing protein [Bryobacteraceae bacterium]